MIDRWIIGLSAALLLAAGNVYAQEPPDTAAVADTVRDEGPVPRNYFFRSLVIPGWGQGSLGSYGRGAFFFGLRGASYYMLGRSIGRLDEARDVDRLITGIATDSLRALMAEDTALARQLEDPVAFDDAVAEHPGVASARRLVDVRRRHRQDWIVYTIFFTFLDAVDAYVAAHLADFPVDISTAPARDGGAWLSVRIPVGRRR